MMNTSGRDADGASLGALIKQLRETGGPELRAEIDEQLRQSFDAMMARYKAMDETVAAVRVLHRPGAGERAGFCAECGNVVPCQTRKFLEPFE